MVKKIFIAATFVLFILNIQAQEDYFNQLELKYYKVNRIEIVEIDISVNDTTFKEIINVDSLGRIYSMIRYDFQSSRLYPEIFETQTIYENLSDANTSYPYISRKITEVQIIKVPQIPFNSYGKQLKSVNYKYQNGVLFEIEQIYNDNSETIEIIRFENGLIRYKLTESKGELIKKMNFTYENRG